MVDQRVVLIGVANTILIAAGKEDTGGTFALLDYELAPGHSSLPPHSHGREDEAVYLLEGSVLVRIGEAEHLLGPGDFVALPRGVVHALHNPGPEPARFLLLLLPAGSEQCWRDLEAALRDGLSWKPAAIAPLLRHYGIQLAVESGLE